MLGILVLLTGGPATAYPRPGTTERVSVASDGTQANAGSLFYPTAISADGRYVAFHSGATNLVPGDTNEVDDVFVRDRAAGTTERVSVASDGTQSNSGHYSNSSSPAISADGRYVAFQSGATNLVPGDTNEVDDVFVHDRAAGTTERVSVASDGTQTSSYSYYPAISADGRYVAFYGHDSNLVPGDTNETFDVFVHDRVGETTERVSVASDGTQGNDASSSRPSISADGRYVAFESHASNLVPGDTNDTYDVFVHDRVGETTERVSVASDGTQGYTDSYGPEISADGRHVAFYSYAFNLVPGDTNWAIDVFLRDREAGTTELVSVDSDGTLANNASYYPEISADGRYVTFESTASNLVPGDTNETSDAFVHDRATGITERVSVASDGTQANSRSRSSSPVISADGRYVAFWSHASNLVPGDSNDTYDAFVRDRGSDLGQVGSLSLSNVPRGVAVLGQATFSGTTLTQAADPDDDGGEVGALSARDLGAELTGAALTYRPEEEDLLLRLDLASLPPAVGGLPGVLYGLELKWGGTAYEVRALRVAASSPTSQLPHVALYRCAPACAEQAPLTGSFGSTGAQVLVSVPLAALGAPEGTPLADLRAFTALGEAAPGALHPLDEVSIPPASIPLSRVELGIAPRTTPEGGVAFTTSADLLGGEYSGTVPTSGLPSGDYRIWARACLGEACGPGASGEVPL